MKPWIVKVIRFLLGSGAIQAINMLSAIILLRILSIQDFAIYTFALSTILMASLFSNMGISQAVITIGALHSKNAGFLGELDLAARGISKFMELFVLLILFILYLTEYIGVGNKSFSLTLLLIIIGSSWIMSRVTLQQAILNIQHDDSSIILSGFLGAISRLLSVWICFYIPSVEIALVGNLIGLIVVYQIQRNRVARYVLPGKKLNSEISRLLLNFIKPLFLSVIYFAFQNQLSIFIFSFQNQLSFVAELGALGKIMQLVGWVGIINPYLIHPIFARISDRKIFLKRLFLVAVLIFLFSLGLVASSVEYSDLWLSILGDNYSSLKNELPIAVFGSAISLSGGILYTIVISRNYTSYQYLTIVFGIAAQFIFILTVGVHTVVDAVYLNIFPAACYMAIQILILLYIIKKLK